MLACACSCSRHSGLRLLLALRPSTSTWTWMGAPRARAYAEKQHGRPQEVVFYKWPTMRHLAFVSRLKVYQVTCMLALLAPVTHWYCAGVVGVESLVCAWSAGLATSAGFCLLSYYLRRFVGEMALLPDPTHRKLRVSLLTFWGRRRELVFPLEQVVPFSDSQTRLRGIFQTLEVAGSGWRMLYSLRHGQVLDAAALREALGVK